MTQNLAYLKETASQTAGPYVHIGLTPNLAGITGVYREDLGSRMVGPNAKGERITVTGRIIDGGGNVLKDAMIEIWQADANGLYNSPEEKRGTADPDFTGWGRSAVDGETGLFRFETVKPGIVPFKDGQPMAPHVTVWIVARGINTGLQTRMLFPDEPDANATCPVMKRIEHRQRIDTLVAKKVAGGYHFEIHLQGENETVFFDI